MRNTEIRTSGNLLGEDGRILEPGWMRSPIKTYNREAIAAPHAKVKEWDYYLVMNEAIGFALTVSDLGYLRMVSASFIDFDANEEITKTKIFPPVKDYFLPAHPEEGEILIKKKGLYVSIFPRGNERILKLIWRNFHNKEDLKAYICFSPVPKDALTIATPFGDKRHFYYNQKINCMPADSSIQFNGKIWRLKPDELAGVLDWGRGFWPYHTNWYWATASGYQDGVSIGFNLGYGFGDTKAASENVFYYDGKLHKLDDIYFVFDENNPMAPWQISSSDGRLEGIFRPVLDRAADINLGLIRSNQHQYFGHFQGSAVLDDEKVIDIRHLRCAIEDIKNRY